MWTKQKKRSNKGRFIVPILTIAVLSYFGYHIYHGENGIYSREKTENFIKELKKERDGIVKQRLALQARVNLLKDGTIEKDMLDEYARRSLNLSKANELTILTTRGDLNN